jgi:hypothetical protein
MDRPEILTIKTTLSAAHLMLLAELPNHCHLGSERSAKRLLQTPPIA